MEKMIAVSYTHLRAHETRHDLVTGLVSHGHRHAVAVSNVKDLSQLIAKNAKSGDIVICLGAGTISSWANSLPKLLYSEC